ncbi:MAG TPA: ABC transporter permease [Trebonia sp.]|jgi:ABC-2 type transport system permease protein|nr:ABC transporter permease [Trebonia sp.]
MKAARDTWLTFQREMLIYARTPMRIALSLAYPITYMLLYAPLLRRAFSADGIVTYTQAYRVYVPGLLTYTALLGGIVGGYTLLAEMRAGIIERSRVTPASRVALILGRAMGEVVDLLVQGVVITIMAVIVGLRLPIGDLLLGYVLFCLVAMTAVMLSYGLTLWGGNVSALSAVNSTLSQPVMLLSGMLLPLVLAPLWMIEIARVNPFYWATNGARALFDGHAGYPSVWASLLVLLGLAVLATAWSMRLFARTVR